MLLKCHDGVNIFYSLTLYKLHNKIFHYVLLFTCLKNKLPACYKLERRRWLKGLLFHRHSLNTVFLQVIVLHVLTFHFKEHGVRN